jgi:hypothetical protein
MDIEIKHISTLLELFKELKIYGFENCNVAKQISAQLIVEIKFREHIFI